MTLKHAAEVLGNVSAEYYMAATMVYGIAFVLYTVRSRDSPALSPSFLALLAALTVLSLIAPAWKMIPVAASALILACCWILLAASSIWKSHIQLNVRLRDLLGLMMTGLSVLVFACFYQHESNYLYGGGAVSNDAVQARAQGLWGIYAATVLACCAAVFALGNILMDLFRWWRRP